MSLTGLPVKFLPMLHRIAPPHLPVSSHRIPAPSAAERRQPAGKADHIGRWLRQHLRRLRKMPCAADQHADRADCPGLVAPPHRLPRAAVPGGISGASRRQMVLWKVAFFSPRRQLLRRLTGYCPRSPVIGRDSAAHKMNTSGCSRRCSFLTVGFTGPPRR